MPYLGMDLDAKKKIPLVANALGLHPGIVAWGLLNLWEYCWANGVEVVSELVLSGCVGDVRLPEVLEAYGFLERVSKGWTSEITTQPIPADAWRVRGAKKYLNLKAGNSKGGHAAKGNLIPGGPKRVRSAGAEGEPRGSPAESSARPRPFTQHPAPNTQHQDLEALAGASGDPPPQPVQVELVPGPKVADLQDAWNELTTPPLPRWKTTPKDRARAAKNALARRPLEEWREVFRRIEADDYCRGGGSGGWVADIDYAIRPAGVKPEPAAKILERPFPRSSRPDRADPDQGVPLRPPVVRAECEACGAEDERVETWEHGLCPRCSHQAITDVHAASASGKYGEPEIAAWIQRERTKRGAA